MLRSPGPVMEALLAASSAWLIQSRPVVDAMIVHTSLPIVQSTHQRVLTFQASQMKVHAAMVGYVRH